MVLKKTKSQEVKKEFNKRFIIMACIVSIFILGFILYMFTVYNSSNQVSFGFEQNKNIDEEKRYVDTILNGNRAENNFALLQSEGVDRNTKKIKELEEQLNAVIEINKTLEKTIDNLKQTGATVIDAQGETIKKLQEQIKSPQNTTITPRSQNSTPTNNTQVTYPSNGTPFQIKGVQNDRVRPTGRITNSRKTCV